MTEPTSPNIAHIIPPDFYEKTLRNIANLRQEYEHNDTLHRCLGDAEAAIATLIVLEAEATKEKKHLRADLEIVQGRLRSERVAALRLGRERDTARTDRDAARSALGAEPNEPTEAAAVRVVKLGLRFAQERDTARGAVQALEATVRRLEANRDRCFREALPLAREAMGALTDEPAHVAAYRVVRERDEARAAALEARNEIEEWRTRFDALATRAADLVKERDEARAALAEPFKVGDRVVNVAEGNTPATVIGFFDSIEGVRFVAVESPWGKSYCWRLDLCNPVKS